MAQWRQNSTRISPTGQISMAVASQAGAGRHDSNCSLKIPCTKLVPCTKVAKRAGLLSMERDVTSSHGYGGKPEVTRLRGFALRGLTIFFLRTKMAQYTREAAFNKEYESNTGKVSASREEERKEDRRKRGLEKNI